MKKLLLSFLVFSLGGLKAQQINFTETAEKIQKKVLCCSVPLVASRDVRVNDIVIDTVGNVSLFYSDKRPKNSFNLFELFKENEWENGIDTILSGKFIQFSVSKDRVRLIRFATAQDAKDVYQAFLQLSASGQKTQIKFGDLNISQSVALINSRLSKWAEKGNAASISALEDGTIIITNKKKQSFKFNLMDLIPPQNNNYIGVETHVCNSRSHAPLSWINFNSVKGSAGFIRLDCNTPEAALQIIQSAFLHLLSLAKNQNTFNTPPPGARHFISRNAVINQHREIVTFSIRSTDKKMEDGSTLVIKSNGEGWLDKDSMPIGEWRFYAISEGSKEYLFKWGTYQRTAPDIFVVRGIDSTDLAKDYFLSFTALQENQVQTIPFIKSGDWTYHNANGGLWKKMHYINKNIPITTIIMLNDFEKNNTTSLIVELKENIDEWEVEQENK